MDYLLKKGQIGLEFMIVVMVAVGILIVFVGLLTVIMANKQDEVKSLMAQSVADGFSKELLFASEAERGYVRIIEFPKLIEGASYIINLESFEDKSSYFELTIKDSVFFKSTPVISQSFLFDSSIHSNKIMISKKEEGILVEVAV